jgi:hypothetical protein
MFFKRSTSFGFYIVQWLDVTTFRENVIPPPSEWRKLFKCMLEHFQLVYYDNTRRLTVSCYNTRFVLVLELIGPFSSTSLSASFVLLLFFAFLEASFCDNLLLSTAFSFFYRYVRLIFLNLFLTNTSFYKFLRDSLRYSIRVTSILYSFCKDQSQSQFIHYLPT